MNLFAQDDFNQQYELARKQGDKRFGSECQHTRTRNGWCQNCFRKVIICESCKKPSTMTYEVADMRLCGPCITPQYPDNGSTEMQEHTDEKPFCSDPKCPCHDIVDGDPRQNEAYHRLIVEPLQKGLITATEANHIFFND